MFLILQKQFWFQSYEILLVIYNKVLMKSLLNQCCTQIQAIKKLIVFRQFGKQIGGGKNKDTLNNK